jgi:hypothetical protein
VFPLGAGTKVPVRGCSLCYDKSPEYVPHLGVDDCPHPPDTCHGFRVATTDPNKIQEWAGRYPDCNWGISTGPARLAVIDLDTNKDGDPPPAPYDMPGVRDGYDVFALALERYGQAFPGDTLLVTTPSGGLHIYWALPPGLVVNKSEGKFGWLVDVRSTGSYIVAPTSVTRDGEYRRIGDVTTPAPAPQWLLHHLDGTGHMPKPKPPRPIRPRRAWRSDQDSGDGAARLQELADELAATSEGARHSTLVRVSAAAAWLVSVGKCTEDDMRDAIFEAGRAVGQRDNEIHSAVETALLKFGRGAA